MHSNSSIWSWFEWLEWRIGKCIEAWKFTLIKWRRPLVAQWSLIQAQKLNVASMPPNSAILYKHHWCILHFWLISTLTFLLCRQQQCTWDIDFKSRYTIYLRLHWRAVDVSFQIYWFDCHDSQCRNEMLHQEGLMLIGKISWGKAT